MEIVVLNETKTRIELEIRGEGHTLLNAIKDELWTNKHIKIAGYQIEHPLVSNPVLVVETDGDENPRKAITTAIADLKKKNKEFSDKIKIVK